MVGDFDRWDGRRLPMHRMPMSGIFEIFVPGVQAGASYPVWRSRSKAAMYSGSLILTEMELRERRL